MARAPGHPLWSMEPSPYPSIMRCDHWHCGFRHGGLILRGSFSCHFHHFWCEMFWFLGTSKVLWEEFSMQRCMVSFGHRNLASWDESSVVSGAMGAPLMMLCVLLILETPCPGVGMLPRELSIDPGPQERLREMMTCIVRMEVVCLKLCISVHGNTKNCPSPGGNIKLLRSFATLKRLWIC